METGKTTKYLKYAIGEILLVIIGILLALQINSWNDSNTEKKELYNSLKDLIEELDKNVDFIAKTRESTQNRIDGIQKIISKTATVEEQKNVLNYFGQKVKSIPFNKVFELLKDEKKLRLIENKELVKKIDQFFEFTIPDIDDLAKWHENFVTNNIDTYIIENVKSDNFQVQPEDLNELLKDLKFNNILSYQKTIYESYIKATKNIPSTSNELKISINNYLKQVE